MREPLTLGFRAHIDRHERSSFGRGSLRKRWTCPEYAVVFDTETTADAVQRFLYGWYRVLRRIEDDTWIVIGEGIVHADDLATRDPAGYRALQRYAATHTAEVVGRRSRRLGFHPRERFIRNIFMRFAYFRRGLVVGFNLPFDLSRLAIHQRPAGGKHYRGGFTFFLTRFAHRTSGEHRPDQYYPPISIKALDNARAFTGFRAARAWDEDQAADVDTDSDEFGYFAGHFLDVRTLLFALTDQKYSLDRAAKAFLPTIRKAKAPAHGVITRAHVAYARQDVRVTEQLFTYALREFAKLPIALDPCKAFSSATIAKEYLRAMGITPPKRKYAGAVAPEQLGWAMAAYYGGRAGVFVRRQPVPVAYLDFQSMYPTVFTLMGLWRWVIAERLDVVDCTEEVRALLARVTLDGCFARDLWGQLGFFAEIDAKGESFPVRAPYDADADVFTIGFNRLHASYPVIYAGPDVVTATLDAKRPPRVRRAFKLVPVGIQEGLQSITLPHGVTLDPARDDFFKTLIEERLRQKRLGATDDLAKRIAHALKILANSGAYGIFAEVLPQDVLRKEEVSIHGRGAVYTQRTVMPEEGGQFYFPPLAALVTSAARLMLGLGEMAVRARGGCISMCDTDSLAPVATRHGGALREPIEHGAHIRALSWREVRAIQQRFVALNPYDRSALPGSILDLTKENRRKGAQCQLWFLGISAKRYALYERQRGGVRMVSASESGLGQYVSPDIAPEDEDETRTEAKPWIQAVWRRFICLAEGRAEVPLAFLDLPAVTRYSLTAPDQLRPFVQRQAGVAYEDGMKPFNFLLSAFPQTACARPTDPTTGRPVERFLLLRAYESDRARWLALPWLDKHTGRAYPLRVTGLPMPDAPIVVKSLGYLLDAYAVHPETKSMSPDGAPCDLHTRGLLVQRVVYSDDYRDLGKEANKVERVLRGLEDRYENVQAIYTNPAHDPFRRVYVPRLREVHPRRLLARAAGITERALRSILNGFATPRPFVRRMLMAYADGLEPPPRARQQRAARRRAGRGR